MEIGPFGVNDLTNLEEILQDRGVHYEILVDNEEKERLLEEYRQSVHYNPKMPIRLDMKFIWVEIPDADFEKIKDVIENYGIVPISDGSFELGED
jgi:hypothetical protein